MDHHFGIGAYGTAVGFDDKYYKGRPPAALYIPRFRNLGGDTDQKDFIRGYGYEGGAGRGRISDTVAELKYGPDLKDAILKPGEWQLNITAFGETLPNHNNRMYMDYNKLDEWGLPTVTFDADFGENELAMRKDMKEQAAKMLEAAGFKDVGTYDDIGGMGLGIHEMGTARMGHDPKTSVLNKYNQIHACTNVYVTDGAFMTSSACQNPSLSYMAFTARAANHAASEFKKSNT
jgi:choline dehydrogenase-like flavoprotein